MSSPSDTTRATRARIRAATSTLIGVVAGVVLHATGEPRTGTLLFLASLLIAVVFYRTPPSGARIQE